MKEAIVCGALIILLALQVGLIVVSAYRVLCRYRHRRAYEIILAVVIAFGFLDSMARKPGQNSSYNGGTFSQQGAQVQVDVTEVTDESEYAEESVSITNDLQFTGVCVSSNSVMVELSWREGLFSGGETIDLFTWYPTFTNDVQWVKSANVVPLMSNLVAEISLLDLGCTNMPSALFLKATERSSSANSMEDGDGDGIPDLYELHNGTNPYVNDYAMAPKLTVGVDSQYRNLGEAFAASTNFSIIAIEDSSIISRSLEMPPHPIMLTGKEDGYSIVRSAASPYAFAFADGQDERTLIRNLYLDFSEEKNLQVGFWCGSNLPVQLLGSPPASPRFQNVYIRARQPSTRCIGWLFRGWNDSQIKLEHCVINALGSSNAVGVALINAPEVKLDHCSFLNFPESGTALQVENYTNGVYMSEDSYSVDIVNTLFDDSFTNANVIAKTTNGVPYVISIENAIVPAMQALSNNVETSQGVIEESACVYKYGPARTGSAAAVNSIGAFASIEVLPATDSDQDGVTDADELTLYDTNPYEMDSDFDMIEDVVEVLEDTDPNDRNSYCFNLNVNCNNPGREYAFAKIAYFESATNINPIGPVFCVSNLEDSVSMDHYVIEGDSRPYLICWSDVNGNNTKEAGECYTWYSYSVTSHFNNVECIIPERFWDGDGDGMADVWEVENGLCATNSADAFDDLDQDGLINIHEYWTGCDVGIPDGSNSLLSIMTRSINERIADKNPSVSMRLFTVNSGTNIVINENCWAKDIDFSCSSVNSKINGVIRPAHLISRRHVLFAAHHAATATNNVYRFMGRDGNIYEGTLVATNYLGHNDITIGVLKEEMSTQVSTAKILSSDYEQYINNGMGLPVVQFDYEKKAVVAMLKNLSMKWGSSVVCQMPFGKWRNFYEHVVIGDSGNARFLVVGSEVVLLNTHWKGPNSPSTGSFLTALKNEIQEGMDLLLPGYEIDEFSLERFPALPAHGQQ